MPTVAVVIIGNEILTGKFADENGPFLVRRLAELSSQLIRLCVVPDDLEQIAAEVRRCAALADLVVTTGGVGPTHDDCTMEGIGLAFGRELELQQEILELMDHWEVTRNVATERMARLPRGTVLIHGGSSRFPVCRVENVYVFPGVPRLMRLKFATVEDVFRGEPVYTARLSTRRRESSIASPLSTVQHRFPQVAIGSYPRYDEEPFRVIVTFEGRDKTALAAARAEVAALIDETIEADGT